MVLGDLEQYMQKNETRPPAYTIHQHKFKVDKRCKHSHIIIKFLEENIGGRISDIPLGNIFTDTSSLAREIKEKNKHMGLHQIKKLLHG